MTPKPSLTIAEATQVQPATISPISIPARPRRRHRVLLATFAAIVLLPGLIAAVYLFLFAEDQYQAEASFYVKSQDIRGPLDALSAFTQVGRSSVSDTSVIYDFALSKPMVQEIDAQLDLQRIYGHRPRDPVFALWPDSSGEDLLTYWRRMVYIAVDGQSGIIRLRVRAFDPEDARDVTQAIIDKSARLVETLSQIAQADTMRLALDNSADAEAKLRDIRARMLAFRTANRVIDPGEVAKGHIGLVAALQAELARALVRRNDLTYYASEDDPRIAMLDRQIRALRSQIEREQAAQTAKPANAANLPRTLGDYEELQLDLQLAEQRYSSALASVEQARTEARTKSRYLAVSVPPTLADESLYPDRFLLLALVILIALVTWSVGVLVYYNVRERG